MDDVVRIGSYADIEGWFTALDKQMFDTILSEQSEAGTLVELGAYMGRSAVVIADHRRPDERFVVIDLFGSDAGLGDDREDDANKRENAYSYKTLSRERFEANFLALHPELPHVVQGLSSLVSEQVEPGSARFVHIDASHMYDKVAEDIAAVERLVQPDGVVVLDDFRSPHTPGVAAATWEAVREGRLKPFAISPHKLYGTWGDADRYRDALVRMATDDPRLALEQQPLREHTIARIFTPKSVYEADAAAARERRAAKAAEKKEADDAAFEAAVTRRAEQLVKEKARAATQKAAEAPRTKQLLRDWTPPAVARAVRARRRRNG